MADNDPKQSVWKRPVNGTALLLSFAIIALGLVALYAAMSMWMGLRFAPSGWKLIGFLTFMIASWVLVRMTFRRRATA